MSTYTLFDDLQDQAAIDGFLAREADRKADLHRRALQVIQDQTQERHIPTSSWSESSYADLLAGDQDFSEDFQIKFPALATWLASCGFKFAGMFFAPLLVIGVDDDDAMDVLSLEMTTGTSVVY